MTNGLARTLFRRDLFRLAIAGTGVVAIGSMLPDAAAAKPVDLKDKRRARYQPDSAEVRNFYRVNSYPGARP
ncbi:MAG TPA: hypothetical protein VMU69_04355 [Bradyrhizobium sp.]|nr:hypothetical protein [Bradyrhizobium sp.]